MNEENTEKDKELPQQTIDVSDKDKEEKKRAPPPRADPSKMKGSGGSSQSYMFSSSMTMEQVKDQLAKIFVKAYEQKQLNDDTLSDYLSVRKLRIIIRLLKLTDKPESSLRKPILCKLLLEFLNSDQMKVKYEKASEEREKQAKQRAERRAEKAAQKAQIQAEQLAEQAAQQTKLEYTRTSRKAAAAAAAAAAEEKRELTKSESHGSMTDLDKFKKQSGQMSTSSSIIQAPQFSQPVSGMRFDLQFNTLKDSSKALQCLQKMNAFVWELSDRITELERAISILVLRISEAEKTLL
ncbi:hypothetical protein TVAG_467760 [Trichomonas vaginalis G3]|uniref:Uncharacterized protein n=1 Tax=Trichomonas vaginalis (strain ATCC PRA-98 / G3) TaxID=412133 RepID=A2E0L6_TRIV3|nr:hypothetical protein TVAGG3_0074150 [Trichomonas vaginalis G3]EAY13761.1 hypothetical protein TVAG_467760 [Trichomonas vaginalis G3]KAI5542723.1 hypothetical protein TVAGG3_0074150 [Trichomonas vaginalis G3]|eukprot:XP_001325984.1 hypothetical protein [Trichomonas vaginalis G3]